MKWRVPPFLLLTLLSGCQSLGPLEPIRELFRGEAPVEPPAPLPEVTPRIGVVVLWRHLLSGEKGRLLGLKPAVSGEELYLATPVGELLRFDLVSGKLLKRKALPFPFTAGPTPSEERLYLGAENLLVAASMETLEPLWKSGTSGLILAPPTPTDGGVAVLCSDGVLEFFDLEGRRLWHYRRRPPPLSLRGDPAPRLLEDGTLLVAFPDGTVARFEPLSGKLLWERQVAVARGGSEVERVVDINETPVVEGGVAYLSAYYGGVMAISLTDGEPLWVRPDIVAAHAPALDFPFLLITDQKSDLWALDSETGQSYWKQEALHRRGLTAPVVVGDLVAVGDFEGYVHFLTRQEGEIVGRIRVADGPIRQLLPVGRVGLLAWSRAGHLALIGIQKP